MYPAGVDANSDLHASAGYRRQMATCTPGGLFTAALERSS